MGETGACDDISGWAREKTASSGKRLESARDACEDARASDDDANVFLASNARVVADAVEDARREGAIERAGGSWALGHVQGGLMFATDWKRRLTSVAALFYRSRSGYGGNGSGMGSSDYYSNVPPPREEEDSMWGWLTGEQGGGSNDETWNWISNQMSYLALEASRQIKGVTDAIAEEILGPPEEELGEEVEEITEEERERADVVSGGMGAQANRRTTQAKSDASKTKPKKPARTQEYDDEEEDDVLGGVLNLLGLEDEEYDDEPYVRRDSKKDK